MKPSQELIADLTETQEYLNEEQDPKLKEWFEEDIRDIRAELNNRVVRVCCVCDAYLDDDSRVLDEFTQGQLPKSHGYCKPHAKEAIEQAKKDMATFIKAKNTNWNPWES